MKFKLIILLILLSSCNNKKCHYLVKEVGKCTSDTLVHYGKCMLKLDNGKIIKATGLYMAGQTYTEYYCSDKEYERRNRGKQ